MKKLILMTTVATAALTFTAACKSTCESGKSENAQTSEASVKALTLTDVPFELEISSLKGVANPGDVPAQKITINFSIPEKAEAGQYRIAGCSGVNRYFGTADAKDGTIKFAENMGSTRMAGPGMGYEDAYLKTLSQAVKYKLDAKTLSFYNKDGVLILKYTY